MAKFKRKKATINLLQEIVMDLSAELDMALDYIQDQEQTIEELVEKNNSLELEHYAFVHRADVYMRPADAD